MVSRLEFTFGPDAGVGPVMEEAIRQGAADTLVEEREEQGDLDALGGQAISVTMAVAFEQAMGSELAQVIAKLREAVALAGQSVGAQHRLMKGSAGPAADGGAAVEKDFE